MDIEGFGTPRRKGIFTVMDAGPTAGYLRVPGQFAAIGMPYKCVAPDKDTLVFTLHRNGKHVCLTEGERYGRFKVPVSSGWGDGDRYTVSVDKRGTITASRV
jgi:hypothetical protein